MKAALIAVGSELFGTDRRDSNTAWLIDRLARIGWEPVQRILVDDDVARIAAQIVSALNGVDAVLITGGLGPTEDDRTREALSRALGAPLVKDDGQLEKLRQRFEAYGMRCGPEQDKQAFRPEGTSWIDNPIGSAPGIRADHQGRLVAALPGVPAEMRAMFEAVVLPALSRRVRGVLCLRTLKVLGRTEGALDRQVRDLYSLPGLQATILSGVEGLELRLRLRGDDLAGTTVRLDELECTVRERVGTDLYGVDDDTLPAVVGSLLARAGKTLASAESCTAGLLGATITRVAGSSAWYRGGLVLYDNDLKVELAGVRPQTLAEHGAVSEPVARELAGRARERCGADIGVGITGIAGPGGGTAQRPVGRVHLALEDETANLHWKLRLAGDRESVRQRAVTTALDQVRRRLLAGADRS